MIAVALRRALAGVLTAGVLAAPAGAAAPGAPWHTWAGTSGDNAGHAVVNKGEAIWTNYLFDDYGANVDGFQSMDPDLLIALLSPHAYPGDPTRPVGFAPSGNIGRFRHTGDYGYPPNKPYPQDPVNDPLGDNNAFDNVANVAETRVAADAQYVYLRFSLTDLGGDPTLGTPNAASTVIGGRDRQRRQPGHRRRRLAVRGQLVLAGLGALPDGLGHRRRAHLSGWHVSGSGPGRWSGAGGSRGQHDRRPGPARRDRSHRPAPLAAHRRRGTLGREAEGMGGAVADDDAVDLAREPRDLPAVVRAAIPPRRAQLAVDRDQAGQRPARRLGQLRRLDR